MPDGQRIYAIGDLHGYLDLHDGLCRLIAADLAARPSAAATAVYLGDYVDRGPKSRQLIDRLIARTLPVADHRFLMGNHEEMMWRFCIDPSVADQWFKSGGLQTLQSYGIDTTSWRMGDAARATALRDAFLAKLPSAHFAFLDALRPSVRIGGYFFAHAGIRPGVALDRQETDDLFWIRRDFLDDDRDHGVVVVHGHSVRPQPEVRANRIGIDTGSYVNGVVTCVVLEGRRVSFLQYRRP